MQSGDPLAENAVSGKNGGMLRLALLCVTIGLADSINPTTIGPALYLAGGRHARTHVIQFTLGVFVVYLLGGLLLALGPGQLLLSVVPHPDREDRFVLETIAGAAIFIGGLFLLAYRHRLARFDVPTPKSRGRSSAILGATITAVELPTAFPYFAAIAAVVGSGFGPARQTVLIVLFNICFVLPLVAIVVTLTTAGEGATRILVAARNWLDSRWPVVLATLALLAGAFVMLLGAAGLAGLGHGHFGGFARHFRRIIHP